MYHHEHYAANKARYVAQAAASKRRLRAERTRWLLDYFASHPCRDCGESDPVVLEFDHQRDKAFAIGQALSYRNWQSLLDEIAKCEVVCANCHRRRTARQRGTVRADMAAAMTRAGDRTRTGTLSLEGSRAAVTPRPRGRSGS
jgi:hypothetical protein